MRIAYLTANDPKDRRSWSGTQYYMAQALEKHCGRVLYLGPLPLRTAKVAKVVSRLLRMAGVNYLYTHTTAASKKLGSKAEKKLAGVDCDVIFAPAGSVALANLRTSVPIVYLSDTTQHLMVGYYPEFSNLSKSSLKVADELELAAIRKATALVYPSAWAANSAILDYGAERSSVHTVPFGANVDEWPNRERALALEQNGKCRLLFVGREWERKGGDLAFEALVELERLGVAAELTVVGCRPPESIRHPRLKVIPFLNKNSASERTQLEDLYFNSHFFLLPTRAECFSIALCEANAYGLPILSTQTGGLPELVRDGVNGFLFPVEVRGDGYAARVQEVFSNPARYEALRSSSREEFETRLNWDAWGRTMKTILLSAMSHPKTN
jgi:glycosyltransferase involved in cell wall biosynthesis